MTITVRSSMATCPIRVVVPSGSAANDHRAILDVRGKVTQLMDVESVRTWLDAKPPQTMKIGRYPKTVPGILNANVPNSMTHSRRSQGVHGDPYAHASPASP